MAWIDNMLAMIAGIVVLGLVWCALWASIGAPGMSLTIILLAVSTAAIWFGERRLAQVILS